MPKNLWIAGLLLGGACWAQNPQLIGQYCLTCHSQRLKTAGLTLEGLDPAKASADAKAADAKASSDAKTANAKPADAKAADGDSASGA